MLYITININALTCHKFQCSWFFNFSFFVCTINTLGVISGTGSKTTEVCNGSGVITLPL